MTWVGLIVFALTGAGAFALSLKGGKCRRGAWCSALLVALLVTSVILQYNPIVAAELPFARFLAASEPWGNVVLALASLGSVLPQIHVRRTRVAVTLLASFLYFFTLERASASVVLRSQLHGVPDAALGVCRQTTRYSCGAAAAATWLDHMGIETTEAEMGVRCHTNAVVGTSALGLLMGLRERLDGTSLAPRIERAHADDLDDLALKAQLTSQCQNYQVVLRQTVSIVLC